MESSNVIIRDATIEDVDFVGWAMMRALDKEVTEEEAQDVHDVCTMEDSLYSWKNARICEVDGKVAGCLISYRGDKYEEMREKTFDFIIRRLDKDMHHNPHETTPDEFYLDSMAFLPEFRGYGLGKKMLLDGVEKGKKLGFKRTSLLVDNDKPRLMEYYQSIGFEPRCHIFAFGEDYIRMTKEEE